MHQDAGIIPTVQRQRLRFEGRVQGVGFRATSRAIASGFAVTGWVRNEPDESVLMEVQGAPDEIDRFLAALHDRLGRLIRSRTAETIPPDGSERAFVIRH